MPRKEETERKKQKQELLEKVDALAAQYEKLKGELAAASGNVKADPQFVEMLTARIVALEKKLLERPERPTIKLPGGKEIAMPERPIEKEKPAAPIPAAPEKIGGSLYD